MEVLVALVIMAIIALLASQAFHTASVGASATREAMDRMARIDRAFVLMETDLRNALPKWVQQELGSPLPPVYVTRSQDYWLTVLRGGMDNPLFQPRTEEVRIGYRWIEQTLWRDTWYNPAQSDQQDARQQKLLTGVTDLRVRVLPPNATSLAAGPWLDAWPQNASPTNQQPLPLAVEVTLELEDLGEVMRLFSLLPGIINTPAAAQTTQ